MPNLRPTAVARELVALVRLPTPVRRFYLRALLEGVRTRDRFSLVASTRPRELLALLEVARETERVVELGTGSGWTALALVLDDERRSVTTYDPADPARRDRYLGMVDPSTRARIELRVEPGEEGVPGDPVDLLFIDIGAHTRELTLAAFKAWESAIVPGGIVAFHDYGDAFPGVREAVDALNLQGELAGVLFVWRKPASAPSGDAR